MNTDISLVIPTYNRGELLTATVESALSQTIPFKEIIVVDDGSTDDTEKRMKAYRASIVYIKTENQGVQMARNTGFAAARSPYVTLCDSDDLLAPEFMATTKEWLSAHPETDLIYCNFVNFGDGAKSIDKFSQGPSDYFNGAKTSGEFIFDVPELYIRSTQFQPMFPTGSTCRRDFYLEIGGYDPRFKGVGSEDWEFCLRATSRGNIALCTKPLARIRRHAGNDSASSLHMNLGEIHILEYALEHHASAKPHAAAICAGIRERKIRAFDGAYASENLDLAASLLAQLAPPPAGIKPMLKRLILACPSRLRTTLWKLSTG